MNSPIDPGMAPPVAFARGEDHEQQRPSAEDPTLRKSFCCRAFFALYAGFVCYFVLATPLYSMTATSLAGYHTRSLGVIPTIMAADLTGLVLALTISPTLRSRPMAKGSSAVFLFAAVGFGVAAYEAVFAVNSIVLVYSMKALATLCTILSFQAAAFFEGYHFLSVIAFPGGQRSIDLAWV